jgi:hypothetical protein
MMAPQTCVFCLSQNAMEIRYDKRGKPYLICRLCFTRSFIRCIDAVRGLAVVPWLIDTALAERKNTPAFRDRFDSMIASMQREVKAAGVAPPARSTHNGLPEGRLPVPFVLGEIEGK